MRKIELHDNILIYLPRNEINRRIMDFINQNQIKIKEMNEKVKIGMYGSRLKAHTRGIRADPSILPVKISIHLQATGNGTELNVLMKEGFIGIPPFGMKKKYPKIFARLMNNLKLQFFKEKDLKIEKNKCNNCGVAIIADNQRYCEVCGYELLQI